jgi:NitT/TauT family transport system substrate-binding protein
MQIVTGGQAEFGNVAASSLVQAAGKGALPLQMVALFGQKDSLSIAYFESSGIKTPKDLEGRKLGMVPGSVAFLLWPSFAKANGIDTGKVEIKNWDFRSYYGIFGAKQVDAAGNFTLGSTGEWLFKQKGEIVHQFVFSDSLPVLGSGVVARTDLIKSDPDLVRHFVKATQRAWAFLETDPKTAVPEAAAIVHQQFDETPSPDIIAEYAYEMIPGRMLSPTTSGKPVGWSNPAEWSSMIDLLKNYDTDMTVKPKPAEIMTNAFLTN